ncbi:Crp/Fnr family transcriptional regulator [Desulfoscipio sp. XC116]|uniref:Crp/Fnr family transcriptional regulator n=1 Tax=Desulfoscipio sp. XC116 TaxID=3144975 RepID=UPI00325AD398
MSIKEKSVRIMKNSLLFHGLSPNDCGNLFDLFGPAHKTYLRDEVVMNEGDLVESIGLVCSGRLISERIDRNGKQRLIQNRCQGQVVALEAAAHPTKRCPVTVVCASNAEVIFFPYERFFDNLLPHEIKSKMFANMMGMLAHIVEKQISKIEIISHRSLRQRIWAYLCSMAAQYGSTTFCIYMNREELAGYLGVNRSALSHELSKMCADGLVSFNKNQFTLLDEKEIQLIKSFYPCTLAMGD